MPFSILPHGLHPETWRYSRLHKGLLLLSVLALTGCEERSLDAYLYGPTKSCEGKTDLASGKGCHTNTVYEVLTIQISRDRQEVIYLVKGLRPEEGNFIFGKLNNCKVINRDNFSCDGLVRADKTFVNTEAFSDKVFSISYPSYLLSHYFNVPFTNWGLEILDYIDSGVTFVAVIAVVIFIISVMG
jgi:hypothetical protein